MNTDHPVEIDERTVAIANASYKWALSFVTFALLIDACCRSWFFHEAAWDLLALVVVPGIGCSLYQARQKIWGRRIWQLRFLLALVAAIVAAIVAAVMSAIKVM